MKKVLFLVPVLLFGALTSCKHRTEFKDLFHFGRNNYHNGYEYVDLGLPSRLMWATCNIGAEKSDECGLYFAWGEVEGHGVYSSDNYLFLYDTYKWGHWNSLGSDYTIYKYNANAEKGHNSVVDYKFILDEEDDAAVANWGGKWRMPTEIECQELLDNCTLTWTNRNNINGFELVSKLNGNSIFLPAAGIRYEETLSGKNESLKYWAATCYNYGFAPAEAFCLENWYKPEDGAFVGYGERWQGMPIRPVWK